MNLASSFRKNFAAASLVAASVLTVQPATAQDVQIEPQCRSAGDFRAQVRCSIRAVKKDIQMYNDRSKAKKVSTALEDSTACHATLNRDIESAKKSGSVSASQKRALEARFAACG